MANATYSSSSAGIMEKSEEIYNPVSYSYSDLQLFTDNFNEKNHLVNTEFGKLYRGKIPSSFSGESEDKNVTVKIWFDHGYYKLKLIDEETNVNDEVYFLGHPSVKNHANLVKLIGFCKSNPSFGVVYDLDPLDALHNMIRRDSFTWIQRIKVVFGLARLIDFLHSQDPPYLVRNLDAAHIMIDKDFNPVLFDFARISGGIFGNRHPPVEIISVHAGYDDIFYASRGIWSISGDVYAFGVLLISLISKRVVSQKDPGSSCVNEWAYQEYSRYTKSDKRSALKKLLMKRKKKFFLVHFTFKSESGFDYQDGCALTNLGMRCLEYEYKRIKYRPDIKEVVLCLQGLRIRNVVEHGDPKGTQVCY